MMPVQIAVSSSACEKTHFLGMYLKLHSQEILGQVYKISPQPQLTSTV